MAEKIVIAEFDLDMEAAIKETIRLKEENVKLRATLKDVKESQGELSSEYIQGSAALKANQSAIRTQEQLLIKATTATDAQTGSIDQLRAQLSIVSKQWSALSEAERNDSEIGKDLAAQKLKLTDALKAEEKATGDNTRNVGNYEEATKSMRQEIKELTAAIAKAKLAGDENNATVKAQKDRLGELKDTMGDVAAEAKILGSDTKNLDIAVGTFKAIGSAAQVAEGSMAALGMQDDDLTKSIQRMVAIQTTLTGVQEVGNALQKESAFMIGATATASKLAAVGQAIYATAVGTSTGAMKAFRIALLSTGIGVIIIAIGLLVANWDKLANIMGGNSMAARKLNFDLDILTTTLERNTSANDLNIKIKEAWGAKDSEVTQQLIKNNNTRISLMEDEITKIMALEMLDKATDEQKQKRIKNREEIQKTEDENILLGIQRRKQAAQEEITVDELNLKAINNKKIAIESFELVSKQVYARELENIRTNYKDETEINDKKYKASLINLTTYQSNSLDIEKKQRDSIRELNKQTASEEVGVLKNKLEAYKTNSTELITTDKLLNEEFVTNQRDRNDKIYNDEKDILDKSVKAKLISQSDYNTQITALDKSWLDSDREITAQVATAHVEALNLELEKYIAANADKVNSYTTTDAELNKLAADQASEEYRIKTQSLTAQLAANQISQTDYDNQYLVAKTTLNKSIADLDEQERLRKINNTKTDYDNQLAATQDNMFSVLDIQRKQNDLKQAEEIRAAEKTGASVDLINKKYSKANIILNRAERDAKLSLAKDFASNIATIAGENTKVGKAAAVAAATINTYQAATGAYAALAPIPIVGPVLGIAAAAAAVVSGISQVKKILAVQPGSTPSESSSSASSSASGLTSTLQSANTDIGAGIVSRNTNVGQSDQGAKIVPVLPVDDVTLKQMDSANKIKTASI